MLAINHVTLATATALGLSLYLDQPFFLPLIVFVAFAGLVPDVDHPKSELGRLFKLPGLLLPHRGVTHSLLGIIIFGGFLYWMLDFPRTFLYLLIGSAVLGVMILEKILEDRIGDLKDLSGGILKAKQIKLIIKLATFVLYIFLFLAALTVWQERLKDEMIALLIVGYFAHIIGDFVTKEGVPVLWPLKQKWGLKLFRTGGRIETIIGSLLVIANLYLLFVFINQFGLTEGDYWQTYLSLNL
jgi:membrane-bound metal-dependent hydrolase YbcI (DUF457 family)